ncbi:acylneuraminate cytidylyltransferase family protein [Desulforamulus putei]|uniref:acylneuraminate cytidylyltransferase family protein n=1 Tax=Desulforamulus putei TaxID=74701 RepID=UPI002FDD1119
MYRDRTFLAIIPARGGSKGIPRKNLRLLAGKPLLAWTVEEAKKSQYIDRLILSSEDAEIIALAKSLGCDVPFIRPAQLARDETPGIEPVLHALQVLPEKYDYVVLLQPTSPLRRAKDIDECIALCMNQGACACVSVTEPAHHPYWMYELLPNGFLKPFMPKDKVPFRRQELQPVYALNGAVYVACCDWLQEKRTFLAEETVAFVMPPERSLDVDTELDLQICEFFLRLHSSMGTRIV